MNRSLVSVIMPVYNGEAYLKEAIDSILGQTYDNFEFIIINDGSTDKTAAIIQEYNDVRIRYYEQANQGLAATLNRCIELSKGKYLARQDSDDVSFPERFARQIAFLDDNPDYAILGTWAEIWIEKRKTKRTHKHPSDDLILKFDLLFNNPFVHSSMMIRRSVLDETGVYSTDPSRQPPEDYELWSRVARKFKVANIPEVLQVYREVQKSESRIKVDPIHDRVVRISKENLSWVLGNSATDKKIVDIAALMNADYHLCSHKSKFYELSQLIVMAADNLSNAHDIPLKVLRKRAGKYCKYLRNRYLSKKYGRLFTSIRPSVGIVRRFFG
jgi:glycosyltransferase involved in cell wall biosynthesis